MIIKHTASAGTVTKNDCQVTVAPGTEGIEVELQSIVKHQFGDQMIQAARSMAEEMGVTAAKIKIEDKGSLDYVIRARTETALLRAAKEADGLLGRGEPEAVVGVLHPAGQFGG